MNVLIELKIRGRKGSVAHGNLDQRELAAYWIDVIENSRRRKNKLAKSYKNAKPVNSLGSSGACTGIATMNFLMAKMKLKKTIQLKPEVTAR